MRIPVRVTQHAVDRMRERFGGVLPLPERHIRQLGELAVPEGEFRVISGEAVFRCIRKVFYILVLTVHPKSLYLRPSLAYKDDSESEHEWE